MEFAPRHGFAAVVLCGISTLVYTFGTEYSVGALTKLSDSGSTRYAVSNVSMVDHSTCSLVDLLFSSLQYSYLLFEVQADAAVRCSTTSSLNVHLGPAMEDYVAGTRSGIPAQTSAGGRRVKDL